MARPRVTVDLRKLRNPPHGAHGKFVSPSVEVRMDMHDELPKIEKGIALPDWRKKLSPKSALIGNMDVGDSALFTDCSMTSLYGLASRHHGKKYAIRKQDDGFRIWRKQ